MKNNNKDTLLPIKISLFVIMLIAFDDAGLVLTKPQLIPRLEIFSRYTQIAAGNATTYASINETSTKIIDKPKISAFVSRSMRHRYGIGTLFGYRPIGNTTTQGTSYTSQKYILARNLSKAFLRSNYIDVLLLNKIRLNHSEHFFLEITPNIAYLITHHRTINALRLQDQPRNEMRHIQAKFHSTLIYQFNRKIALGVFIEGILGNKTQLIDNRINQYNYLAQNYQPTLLNVGINLSVFFR